MKTHGAEATLGRTAGLIQQEDDHWMVVISWWWGATNQILGHTLEVGLSESADEWMCSVTERQV